MPVTDLHEDPFDADLGVDLSSSGRLCQACIILLTEVPLISAKCALISRSSAIGIQGQDHLIEPGQRSLRLRMIKGSKVPSWSRDASTWTWRLAPVSTVFGLVPLRTFPASLLAGAFFLEAQMPGQLLHRVSRTVRVSCFFSPSGPVIDQALLLGAGQQLFRHRCSAVGSGSSLLFSTPSSVAVIAAPLPPTRQAQHDWAANTLVREAP
jgi:hypothetical protein